MPVSNMLHRRHKSTTHTNPKMVVHRNKPLKAKRKEFWIWLILFGLFTGLTQLLLHHIGLPDRIEAMLNLADHSALMVEVFSMAAGDA